MEPHKHIEHKENEQAQRDDVALANEQQQQPLDKPNIHYKYVVDGLVMIIIIFIAVVVSGNNSIYSRDSSNSNSKVVSAQPNPTSPPTPAPFFTKEEQEQLSIACDFLSLTIGSLCPGANQSNLLVEIL